MNNFSAATSYNHVIPFLILNWLWVLWCALELRGSRTYGIQNTVVLLLIFFFSIFQYVNFMITICLILYFFERYKQVKRMSRTEGGPVQNVIKNVIRQYDQNQRNKEKNDSVRSSN